MARRPPGARARTDAPRRRHGHSLPRSGHAAPPSKRHDLDGPLLKILRRHGISRALHSGKQHLAAMHRNKPRVVQVRYQGILLPAAVIQAELQRRPDAVERQVAVDRRQTGDLLVGEARAVLADGLDGDFHAASIAHRNIVDRSYQT